MLKHTLILVFLAAFGTSSAVAQEVMTLEKALEVAFEHSPSLIQSKLSLEQQQLNLKAQNASLKSQFSLDVNPFNYTRNNQYDSYNAKWYSSENMSSSASLGITQPIKWTDGTVSLYNDFSWQDASNQTYVIHYGTEKEEITLDMEMEPEGWISIGSFYLPEGTVSITLNDAVSGRYVIADAVKFTLSR